MQENKERKKSTWIYPKSRFLETLLVALSSLFSSICKIVLSTHLTFFLLHLSHQILMKKVLRVRDVLFVSYISAGKVAFFSSKIASFSDFFVWDNPQKKNLLSFAFANKNIFQSIHSLFILLQRF